MSQQKIFIIDASLVKPGQASEMMAAYIKEHGSDIDIQIHNLPVFTHKVPGEVEKEYLNLWMQLIQAAFVATNTFQKKVKAGEAGKGSIKSPMTNLILRAMKPYKASDYTFKEFISQWLDSPIRDLSISINKDKYIVKDLSGDVGEKNYSFGTLKQYFSKNMN